MNDMYGSARFTTLTAHPLAALVALFSMAFAGCSPNPSMEVATYNAGLALGFVDYTDERQPLITDALSAETADMLCAQELWRQADWDAVTAAAASTWPHTYRLDDAQEVRAGGCDMGELADAEVCVNLHCAGVGADMLADCALDNCGAELAMLTSECIMCITATVGRGDVAVIRELCEGDAGTPVYAYDGSFGTGILSRLPLEETDSLVFPSTINRRAVLYARVTSDIGPVHFFCTHLTSNLSSVPYAGIYASWEEENVAQIEAMIAYIDTKTGGSGQVILAGDLNTGPAGPGFIAELPANYEAFSAAGFSNPYATQPDVACTYCDDNPLNLGTMGGDGGLIDHVLLRGIDLPTRGEQFMRDSITLSYEGMSRPAAFSDHYGLRLRIGG